ncbi:hypothetical protein [Streptomyces virginiae]|uniref:hypothetical protein n=1 Tax=Streptomyces virginiae TaxID=1961 RepID=UPI00345515C1
MQIEQALAEIETLQPLQGLPMAWKWSPMPRFVFSLAMDTDGQWAYQMNALDVHDEGLAEAVLAFARQRQLGRAPDPRPFAVAPGFSHEDYTFDAVVAAAPAVHGFHGGRNEDLNEVVSGVFPAYLCEFRGDESVDEAAMRFKRMLRPTLISRPPVPYLRMRYENTRTGGGSVGHARGFTTPDVLVRELGLLEGAPGSFVEFENLRGEVWRIEWEQAWLVNGKPSDMPSLDGWVTSVLGCR